MQFELTSKYKPTGDQPEAIRQLTDGIKDGMPAQVLLGVTGSGKTFTVANVIQNVEKPTLILSHNKTLAAQLYQEMKEKGVGVVGMVIDSVGEDGTTDEDTVKKAQILKEKTGVTYPLLIPDAGNMNGRISGLSSFPESFFVDKDGNIVGDPIMGSRNLEDWKTAVEDALEKINSEK